MSLAVTVLYSEECPNWRTALERVHAAARQARVEVEAAMVAVETLREAERLGFTGSPTIWLEGRDPFAQPEKVVALACRVYGTPEGLDGSPTVGQLADALTRHAV